MLSVGSSRKPSLELFPFISLFLCVIGVLAFLQNLLVMGEIGASEEEAAQPQIFQTAYRIDCLSDRIVLYPPDKKLQPMYETLNLEERAGIKSIEARRTLHPDGQTLTFEPEFNQDLLNLSLNEISTLNTLAKEHGVPYEEYVLLNIHTGGSDAYHYLLRVLDQTAYKHIRSGLDIAPADSSTITVGTAK